MQGLGSGGIVAFTYVIVSDAVTLRDRGKWFGAISLMSAIGAAIGPIMGGLFVDVGSGGWRWIFWVNLPFCGVGLVGVPACLHQEHRKGMWWRRLKELDYLGTCFFMIGLTTLLVPLTWVKLLNASKLDTTNIHRWCHSPLEKSTHDHSIMFRYFLPVSIYNLLQTVHATSTD
jgi:MFS family permease